MMAFSSGRNVLTISAQGKREQEQRERWRKGGGEEGREKKHRVKDCIDTKTNGAQFYRNDTRHEEVFSKSY